MTNLCLLISLVPGAYLSTETGRQWEKWQGRLHQERCKADYHFRPYISQEWFQGTRHLGNTAGSETDPLISLQLLIFLYWPESNFRRVIGTMKGGKRKAKTERPLPTCPSPYTGGRSGRFWFPGVSHLNVCQREMWFICAWCLKTLQMNLPTRKGVWGVIFLFGFSSQ